MRGIASTLRKTFSRTNTIKVTSRSRRFGPPSVGARLREDRYRRRNADAEDRLVAKYRENPCPTQKIENFQILGQIGSGAHGKLLKVRRWEDKKLFALKLQFKNKLNAEKTEAVIREKKLLYAMECDFVVKLYFAFQDSQNLYMIMDYAKYGDLTRCGGGNVKEKTIRYFIAQIVLGVEYLHQCHIVHRDLKPNNILICSGSYLKLADFGLAKRVRGRTYTYTGTCAYMAPEMFLLLGYGKEVDWWAVGVILYRLMYKGLPYTLPLWVERRMPGSTLRIEVEFPRGVERSSPVNNLICGLLEQDTQRRLGACRLGSEGIKRHPWFREISFSDVYAKKIKFTSTFDPVVPKPFDEAGLIPRRPESHNTHFVAGF